LRAEILSGKTTRERKLVVCSGSGGLVPEERVELLAVLAGDADQAIAERAANALLAQPAEAYLAALARPDVALPLLRYSAEQLAEKPGISDALAKNPACPPELLVGVAAQLSPAGVEALIGDLDRLSSAPELPAALAACPALTAEQQQFLQEVQKGPAVDAGMDEAVAASIPDPHKRLTLLQRLARMRVVERMQMALKGGREERMVLIRDPSKVVQRAVMQSPRLTETEVEGYAAMTSLTDDILRLIAVNRVFLKNYSIVRNLVYNPKTPLDLSLHLLPRLIPQDLKILSMNRNIPETLRSTGMKLQRQRSETRKES
jgi:hypothetical protein